ncbi:MAG: hypothetical protein ACOYX1_14440 [Acidobacteriota bacterium]
MFRCPFEWVKVLAPLNTAMGVPSSSISVHHGFDLAITMSNLSYCPWRPIQSDPKTQKIFNGRQGARLARPS